MEGNPFLEKVDDKTNKPAFLDINFDDIKSGKMNLDDVLGKIKDTKIQQREEHLEFMEKTDFVDEVMLKHLQDKKSLSREKGKSFIDTMDDHFTKVNERMKSIKENLERNIKDKYEIKRLKIDRLRDKELKRVRQLISQGDEMTQMKTAEQELERVKREIEEMNSKRAPS